MDPSLLVDKEVHSLPSSSSPSLKAGEETWWKLVPRSLDRNISPREVAIIKLIPLSSIAILKTFEFINSGANGLQFAPKSTEIKQPTVVPATKTLKSRLDLITFVKKDAPPSTLETSSKPSTSEVGIMILLFCQVLPLLEE
jgi:hypothetical protein